MAPRAEAGSPPTADLAFGTVDSWLLWNLTGGAVHATEPSNASRTLLYDIGEGRWSDELLDLFGVPASCLPEVRPTSGRFGVTTDGLPVPAGIPISGIAGDQQAALFGQACFEPGDDQEHLRHGLVRPHERGHGLPRARRGPADHDRLAAG